MANKICKYTLNADGTIPSEIEDGGYFPVLRVIDGFFAPPPQDWTMIGATVDGSDYVGEGEFLDQSELEAYITSAGSFKVIDESNPTAFVDGDVSTLASQIWSKKV